MEEDIILTKNDQFLLIQVVENGTLTQANHISTIDLISGLADNVRLISERTKVPVDDTLSALKKFIELKKQEELNDDRN